MKFGSCIQNCHLQPYAKFQMDIPFQSYHIGRLKICGNLQQYDLIWIHWSEFTKMTIVWSDLMVIAPPWLAPNRVNNNPPRTIPAVACGVLPLQAGPSYQTWQHSSWHKFICCSSNALVVLCSRHCLCQLADTIFTAIKYLPSRIFIARFHSVKFNQKKRKHILLCICFY